MDDTASILACREGRPEAFEHLVRRYQREAVGHALSFLRQRQDAEDAVQEAFLDAFRALPRFDVKRPFYPWLYTLLRNRCLKALARRRAFAPLPEAPLVAAPDAGDGARDAAERLEKALARLSPADREIVCLKHLDGLTYDDIAARLGIPRGTAMSRLFAARMRLRERLLEDPE